ncbi:MAG TPA: M48 family metalloprotease [Candidatus Omnitrophota bacterium]|nr:M48 family metalloprotease [Candidatus Omnitrophota bacterium]HPS37393.1 M48 family metalloprotease [Candidatus Omnitrophota bacterium]
MKKTFVRLLTVSLLCSGCASTTERGLDAPPPAAHLSAEQKVGEQIHREILASFHPYTDLRVVRYVNDTGHSLAVHAKRQDIDYKITILYSEKVYATSAPGGYVYITTGMLNFLQNEAELAAVLAHEIAHQQYVDPRFARHDDAINLAAQAGSAIGPMFGPLGSLGALGLVLLQAYNESSHKTPEERLLESDKVALQYLLKAGYDPQALLDVQEHFLKAGEKMTPYFYDYYQSRPITEARMAAMKKEFQKLPLMDKDLTMDPVEYQDVTKGVREIYRTVS